MSIQVDFIKNPGGFYVNPGRFRQKLGGFRKKSKWIDIKSTWILREIHLDFSLDFPDGNPWQIDMESIPNPYGNPYGNLAWISNGFFQ